MTSSTFKVYHLQHELNEVLFIGILYGILSYSYFELVKAAYTACAYWLVMASRFKHKLIYV